MSFEWYTDFVDLNYKLSDNDLICIFKIYLAPGVTLREATGELLLKDLLIHGLR